MGLSLPITEVSVVACKYWVPSRQTGKAWRRGELRQLLEQQPFDVLAIDESLAGSSGVDFCMAIRGRYPGMTRIVMTNSPTREIVDARSHGVIDGYIVKPVSASTLLAQIRSSRKE